jgi:hypothetical protein
MRRASLRAVISMSSGPSYGPIMNRGPRTPAAVALLASIALLTAACSGGSAGAHVAQLSSTASLATVAASPAAPSDRQSGAVAFAGCMRSHGAPNWPDPDSSGVFDKSKVTAQQLEVTNSQLRAAQGACQHLLPPQSVAQQRLNAAQALQFSACVRSHGVANFPDPDGSGRIPDPASVGIDQSSTQFQAANQACASYRPPYFPSNQAYDSYATTASRSPL